MNAIRTLPIFYDPKQNRWKVFIVFALLISLALGIIFSVFTINIITKPELPDLGLKSNLNLNVLTSPAVSPTVVNDSQYLIYKSQLLNLINSTGPIQGPKIEQKPKIIGFYVNWDEKSFVSLKQNVTRLDVLMPEWLHLNPGDGTFVMDNRSVQLETLEFISKTRPNLKIVPLINNFSSALGNWDDVGLKQVLATKESRTKLVQSLLFYIRDNKFAGINIDFENVPPTSQYNLELFMKELYEVFHAENLEVSQDLPLSDDNFNHKNFSNYNDYIILMSYDEHSSEDIAGPIASQFWFTSNIYAYFKNIPSEKIVVALGNYGYDWKSKLVGALGLSPIQTTSAAANVAEDVSFQDVMQIAKDSKGVITFDRTSFNPYLDYIDKNNIYHKIWYLDAITAFNQISIVQKKNPYGYALWRLGSEDPSVWGVFDNAKIPNEQTANLVKEMKYGYGIDYVGEGEILKIVSIPQSGVRNIKFDQTLNLIEDETITKYSSPYVISRWGQGNLKKIALTFDDGPDPRYTPQILDILKQSNIKATFFVIGANAETSPRLVKRIYNDGHELGSHTFTHPNISEISNEQLTLELNATQRLIEGIVVHKTLLFRSPYGEDTEPQTPEQAAPMETIGKLGYYNVGMKLDPKDWTNSGTDFLISSLMTQVDQNIGNVVLLHDGGGNRDQTVEALPQIINSLRAKGYEFVTISDLIGLKRDDVMPPSDNQNNLSTKVGGVGFVFLNVLYTIAKYLFALGIILGIARSIIILVLALTEKFIERYAHYKNTETLKKPRVSVLIPAYNEELVITNTINQLLRSDYPNFDIIVIDDGSTDKTYEIVATVFASESKVKVLTKPNGGKSSALNFGLENSGAEIVIVQDGDTLLRSDAISKMIRHFGNPKIGAIAGNVKVGNRNNFLTKLQALEYIISQNLDRRAFALLNCITVVPGAIGAWRYDLIKEAGGFKSDTLAEDAELTLRILKLDYVIDYEESALAYTEAPENLESFLKQRFRWMFGILQCIHKHKTVLFNPRYEFLGLFSLPNILIFQLFFNLVAPLLDLYAFLGLSYLLWQRFQHPSFPLSVFYGPILFYLIFLALDMLTAVVGFTLEPRKEDYSLLIYYPIQRIFYRFIIYYVSIKSFLTAIKGHMVGWGKFARTATSKVS